MFNGSRNEAESLPTNAYYRSCDFYDSKRPPFVIPTSIPLNQQKGCENDVIRRSRRTQSLRSRLFTDGIVALGNGFRNSCSDAAYEKPATVRVGDGRRGSVPTVMSCMSSPDDQSVDNMSMSSSSTTTSSRFFNYISRKSSQLKDNLKRTRSTSKLDRKKPSVNSTSDECNREKLNCELVHENGTKNRRAASTSSTKSSASDLICPYSSATTAFAKESPLKRVRSLSRISYRWGRSKVRAAQDAAGDDTDSDVVKTPSSKARLKSARSYESLLKPEVSAVDISPDINAGESLSIFQPRSTVCDKKHGATVSSLALSTLCDYKTDGQTLNWINNSLLQPTVDPQRDQTERTEHQLKLCISEAKNIPPKYKYFCDVCLDYNHHARTATQQNVDMLFWGQQFELYSLPATDKITINIQREADKRKKKDANLLIGYVDIPTSDVCGRQPTERWYPVIAPPGSSGTVKGGRTANAADSPSIRIKAHYQAIHILPLANYEPLIQYIKNHNRYVVQLLEPEIPVRTKDDLATLLVSVLQKVGRAKDFLVQIVMDDVRKAQDNHQVLFRANSIATKAMEAYMKLVGQKYLQSTLGDFVRMVIDSSHSFEVDPATSGVSASELQRRRTQLISHCGTVWFKIVNSSKDVPLELKAVFAALRKECCNSGIDSAVMKQLISSCIFLRFLCPAILSPSLFGLTPTVPQQRTTRNLTLIAKTLQSLANFSRFGNKESYMMFMNQFMDEQIPHMKTFIDDISVETTSGRSFHYDNTLIDLGKEISQLHAVLVECVEKVSNKAESSELNQLTEVLADISDPTRQQRLRRASITLNTSNTSNTSSSSLTSDTYGYDNHVDNSFECNDEIPAVAAGDNVNVPNVTQRYVTNTSVTLSPARSRTNVSPLGQIRSTMREIQGSDQYTSYTSVQDLPIAAPPVRHRPPTPSTESVDRNGTAPAVIYVAETIIDSHHTVEEVAVGPVQWELSSVEPVNVGSPKSVDATIALQQPLTFSNPLFMLTSSNRPPVAPVNGVTGNCSENTKTVVQSTASNRQESAAAAVAPLKTDHHQLQFAGQATNCQLISNPSQAAAEAASDVSSPISASSECLVTGSDVEANDDRAGQRPKRRRPSQVRLGRMSSPTSGSGSEQHFFGSNGALSQTDVSCENVGNGAPLRRSLASSTAGLDTPPDSPSCIREGHGTGPARKNSSSQNSVRMGVRSVQRKVQEQEKTKQEYELELSALRQQLKSAQASRDEMACQLASEREENQKLSAQLQKLSEESSTSCRLRIAEAENLQLKHTLSKTDHELQTCQSSLKNAQRLIEDLRCEIQQMQSTDVRPNTTQRTRYTTEWKSVNIRR